MPSLRERFAIAKSRSPISSSARAVLSGSCSSVSRSSSTSSSIFATRPSWSPSRSPRRRRACRSCRRGGARAGFSGRCRASVRGPSRRAPAPSASSSDRAPLRPTAHAPSTPRRAPGRPPEKRGDAAGQLVDDRPQRIVDGEQPALGRHLREKHALEDVVADLLSQRGLSPRSMASTTSWASSSTKWVNESSVCSRSHGHPSGDRSVRMTSTRLSNSSPVSSSSLWAHV